MITIAVIVHITVSLALIFIVLLQHGKGDGIGAAFCPAWNLQKQ